MSTVIQGTNVADLEERIGLLEDALIRKNDELVALRAELDGRPVMVSALTTTPGGAELGAIEAQIQQLWAEDRETVDSLANLWTAVGEIQAQLDQLTEDRA